MKCAYLSHGIAFSYSLSVKPCCDFKTDTKWQENNNIKNIDFNNWHKSPSIEKIKNNFKNNQWTENCSVCKSIEELGITNSLRQNGNLSYKDYNEDDITLEIRPGVTCNFSCQTCWPTASSRVMQHHTQANLLDKEIKNHKIDNFEFLNPIKHRIKNVIVLGGEPFFDKNCLNFLNYAQKNLKAHLTIFTNGSKINYDFIKNYKGKIKLVFSIDAIGKVSEYIRYGSVWNDVKSNFENCLQIESVETSVNVTLSVYNIHEIHETIDYFLKNNYFISFGFVLEDHLKVKIIPKDLRNIVIYNLKNAIKQVLTAKIEKNQKLNSVHSLKHALHELENDDWDKSNLIKWQNFVRVMDKVKDTNIKDYSDFLTDLLNYQTN